VATDQGLPGAPEPPVQTDERLDSWKEIAGYLRRDITTVRRWEKREGLPVHRHLHERRESVYAFRSEVDAWWRGRRGELANGGVTNGAVAAPSLSMRGREAVAWTIAIACGAAALLLAWRVSPADERRVETPRLQYSMAAPDGTAITAVSLSLDGTQLAFTTAPRSGADQTTRLWVQPLDEQRARPIADTEGAQLPFWSPKGDRVGFFSEGQLWTVGMDGGPPRAIAKAPMPRGGTWGADDTIVFAPGRDGPLFRVAAAGGEPIVLTTVDQPGERGHVWPSFLPDGRRFLYLADSAVSSGHGVYVGSLDGPTRTRVIERGMSNVAYSETGHLLFARDRQLVAQRFDTRRLSLGGDPVVVAEDVNEPLGLTHLRDFAVARDVVVYRARQSSAVRLVWRDRQGRSTRFTAEPGEYTEPALSPDQTRLAVDLFFPEPSERFGYGSAQIRSDIVMFAVDSGVRAAFAQSPGAEWGPVWSPDGKQLVYSANLRDRILELYKRSGTADGDAQRVLVVDRGNPVAQSWSSDGRLLVYELFDPETHADLWILPMIGDGKPEPLLQSAFSEMQGQISPDGRWLAYTSDESGELEIYVQPFRRPGPARRISRGGGGDPRWRHDGRELFYIAADRRFMSVAVETGERFDAGSPVALFDTGMPPHWYEARNLYDVSRDGRFLFMEPIQDDRTLPLTVLVNRLSR
jgi:Tol biopolymer transport system component